MSSQVSGVPSREFIIAAGITGGVVVLVLSFLVWWKLFRQRSTLSTKKLDQHNKAHAVRFHAPVDVEKQVHIDKPSLDIKEVPRRTAWSWINRPSQNRISKHTRGKSLQQRLHERWSWTNADAPSTPNYAMDRSPELPTPLISRLGQAGLVLAKVQSKTPDETPKLAKPAPLLLKNQASIPVLAASSSPVTPTTPKTLPRDTP